MPPTLATRPPPPTLATRPPPPHLLNVSVTILLLLFYRLPDFLRYFAVCTNVRLKGDKIIIVKRKNLAHFISLKLKKKL